MKLTIKAEDINDELLADEIINNLADYELCWRRETGIWK